jgi:hypothetical protein
MENYLLTVLGTFDESIRKEIALAVTPIVDSPNLKFQYATGVLIFHFTSEVNKEDIFEYVKGILFGLSDSFFFSGCSL